MCVRCGRKAGKALLVQNATGQAVGGAELRTSRAYRDRYCTRQHLTSESLGTDLHEGAEGVGAKRSISAIATGKSKYEEKECELLRFSRVDYWRHIRKPSREGVRLHFPTDC